ncbi:MAG: motility protein A [Lachnospiraceae bacterium]
MRLNKASVTGFVFCFVAIMFGIATNGGMKTILNFVHVPSLIVTMGGTLFAVMITSDSFDDFFIGVKGLPYAFIHSMTNVSEVITSIYELSETARREGLLSLEEKMVQLSDPFLQKGISLIVDGSDPELTKDILESEMNHKYENAMKQIQFWQDFGAYAPAWGMVGTLLGLINMMKSMGSNPSAIGAGMSLALITTLYGSIIANWICIPVARRLSKKSDNEYLVKEIIIEGVLSIQAGDNPRIIKEKIKALIEDEGDKEE